MLNKIISFCFLFAFLSCSSTTSKQNFNLEEDQNFPQWLTANGIASSQTSGITFLKKDADGSEIFLIADDVGDIHHLKIKDNAVADIRPVFFTPEAKEYLTRFSKKDFEEIVYDKYSGNVYISLEGNMPEPKVNSGIFKLIFSGGNIFSDTIISIEELIITPQSLFRKYLNDNIAYEGLTADENYFYLGLEGFAEKNIFADSTVLFVVDKLSLEIVKEISTKSFGIHTICGLYSDKNRSLYGVDRNNKKIFHLILDENLEVSSYQLKDILTGIPGYKSLNYVAAIESVTMDDDKNIFLVDDPWKSHYIPPDEVLKQLDEQTIENFKKFIPVIYKYELLN